MAKSNRKTWTPEQILKEFKKLAKQYEREGKHTAALKIEAIIAKVEGIDFP